MRTSVEQSIFNKIELETLREILSKAEMPSEDFKKGIQETAGILIPTSQSEDFYLGVAMGLRLVANSMEYLPATMLSKSIGAYIAATSLHYGESLKDEKWELGNE